MIKFFSRFYNGLKRILSNESVSYRVYLIWGVITLVFFGLFGLLPISINTVSNLKLANEMSKNNKNLDKKIVYLKKMKEDLKVVEESTQLLDIYLPDVYDPQNHVVELSVIVGDAGFSLSKFSSNLSNLENKNYIDSNLTVIGNGNLDKLISDIESSGRLSEIKNLSVSKGKEEVNIVMTIRSYIMEK